MSVAETLKNPVHVLIGKVNIHGEEVLKILLGVC